MPIEHAFKDAMHCSCLAIAPTGNPSLSRLPLVDVRLCSLASRPIFHVVRAIRRRRHPQLSLSQAIKCTELSVEQVQEPPALFHGVISNAEAGVSTSENAASVTFCPKDPGIVAVSGLYVCFLCRRSSRANTIRNNAPTTPATIPYDRVI